MARQSRPVGFDMTYKPAGVVAFGPPIRDRLPAFGYLTIAIAVLGVIVYGENAPSNSILFRYIVEGDQQRILPAFACGVILLLSAVAAVIRTQMRGVVIQPDGIIIRELLVLGWPRVRKFHWSQIDRVLVPEAWMQGNPDAVPRMLKGPIRLDLWDGSRTRLPKVADDLGLAMMLEKLALARAIPIEGGTGMLDDLAGQSDGDEN